MYMYMYMYVVPWFSLPLSFLPLLSSLFLPSPSPSLQACSTFYLLMRCNNELFKRQGFVRTSVQVHSV